MLMHSPASNLMALTTVQIQWFWHSLVRACQVLQQILCLTWYCHYGFKLVVWNGKEVVGMNAFDHSSEGKLTVLHDSS